MFTFKAYDPTTDTVREYTCESYEGERGLTDLAGLAGAALDEAHTGGDFWDDPMEVYRTAADYIRHTSGRPIGSPTRQPGASEVDTAIMLLGSHEHRHRT